MNNEEEKLSDYALTVHQSLMQPIQLFGIGEQAFMVILMFTVIFATIISIWTIAIGVVVLFITKQMCKKEPLLIDFIIENMNQADVYRG